MHHPIAASAPAHQHSFDIPATPTPTDSSSRSSASRRAPRLRVYTRSSLSSSSSAIAESDDDTLSLQSASSVVSESGDELASTRPTRGLGSVGSSRFSSYGSVEGMGIDISTSEEDEVNQRSASEESESSEDGDEEIPEEPLTPKPFHHMHSQSLPAPPATAGVLGSQTTFLRSRLSDAADRRLAGAKDIRVGLPMSSGPGPRQTQPRSPIIFAGGAINPKRDEKKALGLKAAVGSFRRRTASTSSDPSSPITPPSAGFSPTQQPSPVRSSSFPSGLPSPGFSPVSPGFSHMFPGAGALKAAMAAAPAPQYTSYLEQRRQSLMNRAGAGGHRRIVSEAAPRSPGLGRGKSQPLISPLPSLDQIRDWAASRRSSAPTSVAEDPEAEDASTILGQQTSPSSSDGSGPETTILAAEGSISNNLPQSAHVTSSPKSSNAQVYRPPHLNSKPIMTSPAPPRISTSPVTILTPRTSGVRINLEPASALQQGQDALAFAKALLASQPSEAKSPQQGTSEERVERRKALLGGLKKAGERRSASMGLPAGGAVVAAV